MQVVLTHPLLSVIMASQLIPQCEQYSVAISPSLEIPISKILFIKELAKSNLPDDLVLTAEYRQVQLLLSETVVGTASLTQPTLLNADRYPATKTNLLPPMGTLAGTFWL